MIKEAGLDFANLPESEFDDPFGQASGGGAIFGATGGVMEAALRTAVETLTGETLSGDALNFTDVRGTKGIKEASYKVGDLEVKVAVASGLKNARQLLDDIRAGKANYHFVEIMACPGGCVNGGGQPIHEGREMAAIRSKNLYFLDSKSKLRFSHENPEIQKVYDEYLEKPLSRMAHKLLHTDHDAWEMPLAPERVK